MKRTSSLMVVAALFAMVIATPAFGMTRIQPTTSPAATVLVDLAIPSSNALGTVETMSPLPWWASASEVAAITDKGQGFVSSDDFTKMGETVTLTSVGQPAAQKQNNTFAAATPDKHQYVITGVELRRDLRRAAQTIADYPPRR